MPRELNRTKMTDPSVRPILAALFDAAPPAECASPAALLAGAAARARGAGLAVLELGLQPAAEAGEVAAMMAAIALQGVRFGRAPNPTVILGGGPVSNGGMAAGAATLALRLALSLDEHPAVHGCTIQARWDHGPGERAWLAPDTLARVRGARLDVARALAGGAAAELFAALGALDPAPPWPENAAVFRALLLT